jgi:hypothetical protein
MPGRTRKAQLRRAIAGLALSALAIGGIGAYWLWHMSWQAPSWYRPPAPSDPSVNQRADDTEYRVLQQTRQVRQADDAWTLTLSEREINDWLATRLRAWIKHDASMNWPEQIGTPQALIEPDGLSIAVPVTAKGVTRTIVATLRPRIGAAQTPDEARDRSLAHASTPQTRPISPHDAPLGAQLWVPLSSVSLGKVPIPGEPLQRVVDSIREASPEFLEDRHVQQALDVLAGRSGLEPVYRLSDGRVVRITAVTLKRGSIELTARTAAEK